MRAGASLPDLMIPNLEAFLRFMADHSVLAKHLLTHGRAYPPQPLTTEERAVVEEAAAFHGDDFHLRECFYNAQMLVRYDTTNQLKYVEGYGTKVIPCLHGWATINGKVVDLTWRHDGEEKTLFEKRIWGDNFSWEYWGVEIPKTYVKEIHYRDQKGKSLLDDPDNDWPLLLHAPEGVARVG